MSDSNYTSNKNILYTRRLNVLANIGLFHSSFSIRNLVPLLFTPPSPLIPIEGLHRSRDLT